MNHWDRVRTAISILDRRCHSIRATEAFASLAVLEAQAASRVPVPMADEACPTCGRPDGAGHEARCLVSAPTPGA